jgi:chromosome segregation ATPase
LEARRRSRIETELEEIRRETEQEIARREASIASAQAEMRRRLEEAQAERRALVADAAAREAALRGELSELETERRREALAVNRLLDSYRELEALIRVGRADEATEAIDDIRSAVLTGPDSDLPAIAERRAVELFVLDSLESLVALRFENTTDTELQQALAASQSELRDARERVQTLEAEMPRAEALSRQLSRSQAREREARAQLERTESEVRRLTWALESSRANAERSLSSLRSEIARLERELSTLEDAPAETERLSVESIGLDAARETIYSALAATTDAELPLATAREEAAATADSLARAVVTDLRLVLAQSERLSVVTAQEVRLVGTVVSVGEQTLALEPFATSTVDPGDSLWIRRRSGDSEINVGRAVVSEIGDGRIEANLTDTVTTPLVLDLVYVEAP